MLALNHLIVALTLNAARVTTTNTEIHILGATAAAVSLTTILLGQGRQFLKIGRCTPIETRAIDCRAFFLNSGSHLLWCLYGAGYGSTAIVVTNAAGTLISFAVAVRAARMQRRCVAAQLRTNP